jgi:iron complex transport system substrate-binding protein
LLPSATEIVCELGLQADLVGRSHECDFPAGIENLSVCSRPRYSAKGTSPEISKAVSTILQEALSIYRVDAETIKNLHPTHIITQSQCAVCAVSTEELRDALREYTGMDDVTIVDLNPESLDHVYANIGLVADTLDVHNEGQRLVVRMQESFDAIHSVSEKSERKPHIAHIEWIDPMMVAGHWMIPLIELAGGANVFPDGRKRWITFDDLRRQDPDKILIAPCGFSITRARQDMELLTRNSAWSTLSAVHNNEIYISDGSDYFNRPGPRLIDSLEILAEIFHPSLFPPKHFPQGWIKYE